MPGFHSARTTGNFQPTKSTVGVLTGKRSPLFSSRSLPRPTVCKCSARTSSARTDDKPSPAILCSARNRGGGAKKRVGDNHLWFVFISYSSLYYSENYTKHISRSAGAQIPNLSTSSILQIVFRLRFSCPLRMRDTYCCVQPKRAARSVCDIPSASSLSSIMRAMRRDSRRHASLSLLSSAFSRQRLGVADGNCSNLFTIFSFIAVGFIL